MNFRTGMTRALLLGSAVLFAAACGEDQQQIPTETESPIEQVQSPTGDVTAALAVKKRHGPDLMEIEGVVGHGLGMDDGRPVIRVYTMHGNVRGIPDHVENVPIERVATGLIMAGTTSRLRPAPNGFSIGHPDITAGTFGALVEDGNDVCYALSNNHVLANSNDANIGDSALQPGPFDGGTDPDDAIGTLADYEPILFDGSENRVDAAIAEIFAPVGDFALGTTDANGYGEPGDGVAAATAGMKVMKYGRTTVLTTGEVAETNVTVDVCYEARGPFICVSLARFGGQISISPGAFSDGGDSGSLIVEDDRDGANNRDAVGLLFAGSDTRTLANPIQDVYTTFDVGTVGIQTDPAQCTNEGDGSGGDDGGDDTSGDFSLSATAYKVRGLQKADLSWGGATSTDVDVYRDGGSPIVTTENDGFYTDDINQRGSGTYTYQVCEAGTSTCSNEATITF